MVATTGQQNVSPVQYGGSFPFYGAGPQVAGVQANGGTFIANGATPVTVANANLTANSIILISLKTVGGTVGAIPAPATVTPGTGFTIVGTASDTSTYNYLILG
jgi:hypothetical protein